MDIYSIAYEYSQKYKEGTTWGDTDYPWWAGLLAEKDEELTRLKSRNEELEAEKATLIASKLVVPSHPEETFDKVLDVAKENDRLKAENERLACEHSLYASALRCIAEPERQVKYTPQELAKHALRMEPLKP